MTNEEIEALDKFFKDTPRLNKMAFMITCEKFLLGEVPEGVPNASKVMHHLREMQEFAQFVLDNPDCPETLQFKAAEILGLGWV